MPNSQMRNQRPGAAGQTQVRAPMSARPITGQSGAATGGPTQRMGMPAGMQNRPLGATMPGGPGRPSMKFASQMRNPQAGPGPQSQVQQVSYLVGREFNPI